MNGRWVGSFYEWTCSRQECGAVLQSKTPPGVHERECLGCKARDAAIDSLGAAQVLAAENKALRTKVRELEEHLAELRSMVERAHTEPAPSHAPEAAE